jgi:hypothetical protein
MNDYDDKTKLNNEISSKRSELESYLKKLEKGIFDLETKYLENTQNSGNILKGWEQYFTNKSKIPGQTGLNNPNKRIRFSNNERVFSQSTFNNIHLKDEMMMYNPSKYKYL